MKDINESVDALSPPQPCLHAEEVVIGGEAYEVYFCDVLQCVQSLYGDPEFAHHLVFLPERHYADPDHTLRLFHDMHTGKWWWAVQVRLTSIEPSTKGLLMNTIEGSQEGCTWWDSHANHHILRQDAAHPVPQQDSLPYLHHHW